MIRTKIVATLGPASSNVRTIKQLIKTGVNVFRLNFSYGTHKTHLDLISFIRSASKSFKWSVAILQDLQGPRIRTGSLKNGSPVRLKRRKTIRITQENVKGDESVISTTYKGLIDDVKKGDRILLDNGNIELVVVRKEKKRIVCRVLYGGMLGEHKGINIPKVHLNVPSFTEKDQKDLAFGLDAGVDYVACSFVRSADDIKETKEHIAKQKKDVPVIAKIESFEAIDKLDEILDEADGVMVARGDLAVETSIARVPILQKSIIDKTNKRGKIVITATQMLESMIHNSYPTRAEATDISNAICDGSDALMLSGETAIGEYPVQSVRMMKKITRETERTLFPYNKFLEQYAVGEFSIDRATVYSACYAARKLKAKAIIVFTMSGKTAFYVSQFRPKEKIIAITPDDEVYKRLALLWGVIPLRSSFQKQLTTLLAKSEELVLDKKLLKKGDLVVVVAGATSRASTTNMMKIHRIGEVSQESE